MQSPPGATLILPFTGKGRSRPLGRCNADSVPGRSARYIVGAVFEARPPPCSMTTLMIMALSRASAMASRADIGAHVGRSESCHRTFASSARGGLIQACSRKYSYGAIQRSRRVGRRVSVNPSLQHRSLGGLVLLFGRLGVLPPPMVYSRRFPRAVGDEPIVGA